MCFLTDFLFLFFFFTVFSVFFFLLLWLVLEKQTNRLSLCLGPMARRERLFGLWDTFKLFAFILPIFS